MARTSPLVDPEFVKQVAEATANGCSRADMCEMFGVKDRDTISRWWRDPRVKREVLKISETRVIQITRKIDSKIEAALEDGDFDIKDLLAIRKEFLGGALRAQTEKADESTIGAASDWVEANPDLADAFLESMNKVASDRASMVESDD